MYVGKMARERTLKGVPKASTSGEREIIESMILPPPASPLPATLLLAMLLLPAVLRLLLPLAVLPLPLPLLPAVLLLLWRLRLLQIGRRRAAPTARLAIAASMRRDEAEAGRNESKRPI